MATNVYQFSLKKLAILGVALLLVGGLLGYGVFYLRGKGLSSDASYACESERNDVYIYSNNLIQILQSGGQISQRQLVTLEDLIDIWSECALSENRLFALFS